MQDTRIDELKATGRLPSPTGVALAILRLTQDENASIEEIARVLKGDPALSGRILRYANSAFAGARRPAVAVSEAVVRLGINKVTQISLGFSLLSNHRTGPCHGFDYQRFWSESLAAAAAAKELCSHIRSTSPEEAFSFGLLGQIGRLALASVHPERYTQTLLQAREFAGRSLLQLEHDHFALDHNELSAALFRDWRLPDAFADATLFQDSPGEIDLPPESRVHNLALLLHVARHLAAVCLTADHTRALIAPEILSHTAHIGLQPSELISLFDRTIAQWQEWGSILDVETRPSPPLPEEEPVTACAAQAPDVEPPTAAAQPEGMRILAVDDDHAALTLVTRLLAHSGHSVTAADSGDQALKKVLEVQPQVIVTDWMMPGLDGLQLCKALRQSEQTGSIYIIMLTACEDEAHLVEAFEAGADDYVVKPFNPRTLLARVRAARRIVNLQAQVNRDQEEIRRYAAELSVANRKLKLAALTDALTGLPNRRYALDRLEQDWINAARHDHRLGCMLVDVDHFKQVNDSHGHETGDTVLQQIAQALRRALRKSDVVCRFGGEEFLVICKDTDHEGLHTVAEHLRTAVASTALSVKDTRLHVEVSIGVASRVKEMADVSALLRAADQAMYTAKQEGRNRVCLAMH